MTFIQICIVHFVIVNLGSIFIKKDKHVNFRFSTWVMMSIYTFKANIFVWMFPVCIITGHIILEFVWRILTKANKATDKAS